MSLPGVDFGKVRKFALVWRESVRPAITFAEHLRDYITEGHVATLEREQSLIHLGIDSYRTTLARTRHDYHFVVTAYKYNLNIQQNYSLTKKSQ